MFNLVKLAARDIRKSMAFVAKNFVEKEPTSVALRLTTCDFVTTFSNIITNSIVGGHSYAMMDGDVIVAQILNIPYDDFMKSSYGHIRETTSLLALFDMLEPIALPKCMYIFSISSDVENCGLAAKLLETTLKESRSEYEYVVGDCTNCISQHLFKKHGFNVQSEVRYDTFEYGVMRPFRTITDTASVARMVYQHFQNK